MREFVEAHNRRGELADAILLRPPPAIAKLQVEQLNQLTGRLTRLRDADSRKRA